VPDPLATNPELFDLTKKDSPIVEYAKAFKVKPADVLASLHPKIEKPKGMPEFITMRTFDGVALMMATQNENGEWVWQKATPGHYWHAQGKWIGTSLGGTQTRDFKISSIISNYFEGGILGLKGQIRPGPDINERKPSNASYEFELAKKLGMAIDFHYLAEPGKFPSNVNKTNIDEWLNTRLSNTADMVSKYDLNQPVLVVFNEAWGSGTNWNRDSNPLKDKYGEKWVEEYIYQALSVFTSKGLIPNKEFILSFNEFEMFKSKNKQQAVHDKLVGARKNAYERLISNPKTAIRLQQAVIKNPDDIKIILGTQAHVFLGLKANDPSGIFNPAPTLDEINSLANLFSDLGGIIVTEFNPYAGKKEDLKTEFIENNVSVLQNNPNLRGIIFWNLFEEDQGDVFSLEKLELFNLDASPTQLFFELLRESSSN